MAYNGSGVYIAPASPGSFNPALSGSQATPDTWNTLLTDLSNALSTAICRDGQSTISANTQWNGMLIKNLGTPIDPGDAATKGYVDTSITTQLAASTPGILYGLTLSNNSTTGINVAPGRCIDSANAVLINNSASINKLIATAWTLGTGNGGLGNGVSRTASTWYHVFGGLATGGAFDMFYDTSATGANKPAAFTSIRRLGSILTGTGATPPILAFVQNGDLFEWGVWVLDINIASTTNAPANRVVRTPLGIITTARATWSLTNNNATTVSTCYIYNPAITTPTNAVNSQMVALFVSGNNSTENKEIDCPTNTSSQVGTVILNHAGADVSLQATTIGWTDTRGRYG